MRIKTLLAVGVAAAAGAWALRRFSLHEDLDWEECDRPGRLEYIDGYGVHYVERGSGPPMVLVHGFGGHTFSYREMIPRFEHDHRVIAVDLKGFGYSERRADAGLSHTDQVLMLRRLLDRLGVERAVFVGHSMGGAVVHRFAATYPEMCEAIVLAAPAIGRRYRVRIAGLALAAMRPFLPLFVRLAKDRLFATLYYEQPPNAAELLEAYGRPARIRGSLAGLMAMGRDVRSDPEVDDSRVAMPVLLLMADHDRLVPLSAVPEIQRRLPHARLVVIERSAHGLLEERPEECEQAIRAFLQAATGTQAEAAAVSVE